MNQKEMEEFITNFTSSYDWLENNTSYKRRETKLR